MTGALRFALVFLISSVALGVRIKDIASLRGARDNQLIGYGVVVGLNGSGDKAGSDGSNAVMGQFLKGIGVDVKNHAMDTRNAAEVMVVATLPPFSAVGTKLDLTVSSIANATSLEGGVLMMTPLKGADGIVYAIAQGKVIVHKRKDSRGALLSQIMSSGTVYQGGLLEKSVPFEAPKMISFNLLHPDFTTSARMAIRINEELGGKYATASDAGRVDVISPYDFEGTSVEIVALLENIDVEADHRARVVVNERTGTVIMGDKVTLAPVAIAHGNLRLEVANPIATVAPKDKSVALLTKGATIADIANGLNELGASPDDLVVILNSLKSSGALMAELETQ
ncbi:MAG: flagellar basal body P-ring protein FlgI [Deltaproteobacteria bacterium]|nr:flagellar basal body P-ring protein FlgI [Deltaproteobacteria bacterium]